MKAIFWNFKNDAHFKEVVSRFEKIKERDSSFQFSVEKGRIVLYGDDENELHKRATWVVFKCDPLKTIVYTVVR